jgi:hypothetical protein
MDKRRSLVGLLYLAGAGLSGYFLLWYGSWALIASVVVKAFDNMAAQEQPKPADVQGLAITGAVMASLGLCLTLGLLILGTRRLAGKPYPRLRSAEIYLVLSAILVSSTTFLAWRVTASAPVPAKYEDLAGIWRRADDDKHSYRFNPDGTLDSWWSSMPHGKMGRWSRSGQTVTVIYDRDWSMSGTLAGGSFKGMMSVTSTKKPLGAVEWVRDYNP